MDVFGNVAVTFLSSHVQVVVTRKFLEHESYQRVKKSTVEDSASIDVPILDFHTKCNIDESSKFNTKHKSPPNIAE